MSYLNRMQEVPEATSLNDAIAIYAARNDVEETTVDAAWDYRGIAVAGITEAEIACCAICGTEMVSAAAGAICPADRTHRGELARTLADHDADARLMLLEHIPAASDDTLNELIQHTTDHVVETAAQAELQARTAGRFQADYPDRLGR
jgi:hypothetical protein